MLSKKSVDNVLLLVSLCTYAFLGYAVERHETLLLFGGYALVFSIYCYVVSTYSGDLNVTFWLWGGVLFRTLLIFSVPNLSDDFYRFIWDGRLFAGGHHPFAELPLYYTENNLSIPGIDKALFIKLNSPHYFTVYPPISQYIFLIAVKLSPHSVYGSVLIMKALMLFAEIGSILLIKKLLIRFNLNLKGLLIYALNPLIIIEIVGNIHLEGIMIFFLLLAIVFLYSGKIIHCGFFFALAICTKMLPLIFLPALLRPLWWRKAILLNATILLACLVLSLPLLQKEIIVGLQKSLFYYFTTFEFNASLYYVVRWIGYLIFGFNIIQYSGAVLAFIGFLFIMAVSFSGEESGLLRWWHDTNKVQSTTGNGGSLAFDRGLLLSFMLILLIYFLFTTTLHPWYISTLLVLSVFTNFRFPLLWTGLIFLTYAGYNVGGFAENLWLTAIEYTAVLGYLAYELVWERKFSLYKVS